MKRTVVFLLVAFLALASCGGGSNQPSNGFVPNSVILSDLVFDVQGTEIRATNVACTPNGSSCRATIAGETFYWNASSSPAGTATEVSEFATKGDWNYMEITAAYGLHDGNQLRAAASLGILHGGSLPTGSATWTGDLVSLDSNNRVVRGEASIRLANPQNPSVDVLLTPQGRPSMEWNGISVRNGRFKHEQATANYIRGEFYGPNAEEVGGVFERNDLLGAFGAKR